MKKEQELLYLMTLQKINYNKKHLDRIQTLSSKINIELFINYVKKNKCIPLILDYLNFFDINSQIALKNEYQEWVYKVNSLEKMDKDITAFAKELDIKIIEPKGFALSQTIYKDKLARQFADLDFIVPIEQMRMLGELLTENGYFHRHNGRIQDICSVLEKNKNTLVYEIKFLKYTSTGYRMVELKKASDAVPYSILHYFTNELQTWSFEDQVQHFTFSNEGLLLHLCSNINTDHFKYEGVFDSVGKFRDYLDLYFFCCNVKYDYKKFYHLVKKTHLEKSILFCKVIMKKLFEVDIFPELDLNNIDIFNFSNLKSIILGSKKHFFWELYKKKQIEYNKKNKCQNVFSFKKIGITIYKNKQLSKISFDVRASMKEMNNILQERRLFISFISGLAQKECNISEHEINTNSYYSDNYTFCIFKNHNGLHFLANKIKMFSVYNQNTSNEKMNGKKISNLANSDQFKYRFTFDIPEYFYTTDIYINIFTDIKLLDDYYKHDQYLFALGEPFAKIE